MMNFRKALVGISVGLLLSGCGGSSGTGIGALDDAADALEDALNDFANLLEDTSDIEGLWNATVEKDGVTDEIYWDIDASGTLTVYDFDGDAAGSGRNCYISTVWTIESNGGVSTLTNTTTDETRVRLLTVEDNALKVSPVFGAIEIFPSAMNIDPNFNSCD